mgnify:CR=1 FL=1
MNQKYTSLWAVPLWEIDLGLGQDHNDALLATFRRLTCGSTPFNLFDSEDFCVKVLEAAVEQATNEAFSDAGFDLRFAAIGRAWVSMLRENEWDTPHTHRSTDLVGVYYPQVPPGSGALWINDPRGNATFGKMVDGKDGRVGHRIEPRQGMLVLFPGDVTHFVEPHRGTAPRLSVGMNIRLKPTPR